jgi:hypothetical protein
MFRCCVNYFKNNECNFVDNQSFAKVIKKTSLPNLLASGKSPQSHFDIIAFILSN